MKDAVYKRLQKVCSSSSSSSLRLSLWMSAKTMNLFSLFQEWRHAHGMRCLGIPNTAHFANVTQIEDAVSREYTNS